MACQKPSARRRGRGRRYSVLWGWLLRAALHTWLRALLVDKETLIRGHCLPSCSPVKSPLSPGKKMSPECAEVPVPMPGAPGCSSLVHQGHCCAREGVAVTAAHRGGRGTGVSMALGSKEELEQSPWAVPTPVGSAGHGLCLLEPSWSLSRAGAP